MKSLLDSPILYTSGVMFLWAQDSFNSGRGGMSTDELIIEEKIIAGT